MKTDMIAKALAVATMLLLLSAAGGAAKDVDAGWIFNDGDAKVKCPMMCSSAGGTWDGKWKQTGTWSDTCSCKLSGGGSQPAKTKDIKAGPIWNDADADTKCPAVCTSHNATWTKNWVTTKEGEMSTCECQR